MKRTILAILAATLLAGCGSANDSDRAEACDGFARLTPGSIEVQESMAVLADSSATNTEKADALKKQLDALSDERASRPYDCDDPRDADTFARYRADD